ncbi:hypothetical protein CTEN210_00432 [Chaetoceros tenuissimus]|uniref:Uncharacterized protein n=1 Tax=Chaetoceros tenuissimus TaxID=426638 RepID=A0AAD3CDT1_9STRA|nr:hypothetical protein CTEN210_00432 [Chaetoceros tenuissimus]
MDIATFQSNLDFIKSLYFREEWKDKECRDTILETIEEANKKILSAFGKSMHRLYKHKPTVEAVEKVVKKFPSVLSHKEKESENFDGEVFPIQKAACYFENDVNCSVRQYVPVLAKEGMRHNVGGEDARGGLLTIDQSDNDHWNTLQLLCYDNNSIQALKELRKSGLVVKNDIQEYNLLYTSVFETGRRSVFDYLVDWDPNALINSRYDDMPLVEAVQLNGFKETKKSLSILLDAGFKYHPDKGGILFVEDDNGSSTLDFLLERMVKEEFMDVLNNILSQAKDYPILHHIFTKSPEHKDLFASMFPWAGHLRDHDGRSLHQVLLTAGPEVMNENKILFAMLTDNQIREKDPVTTLYPFAAMAVGENADLDSCFYLLRRHPSVLDNRSRANLENRSRANTAVRRRRKKRKISKS